MNVTTTVIPAAGFGTRMLPAAKAVPGGYSTTDYNVSFVGFVPSREPMFTILVVIDTPTRVSAYGGTVAAPVFQKIASATHAFGRSLLRAENGVQSNAMEGTGLSLSMTGRCVSSEGASSLQTKYTLCSSS